MSLRSAYLPLLALGVVLLGIAMGLGTADAQADAPLPMDGQGGNGRYILGFYEGTSEIEARSIARRASLVDDLWIDGIRALSVRSASADLPAPTVSRLQLDPAVRYLEPDREIALFATPNDPLYGSQWGLEKIDAEDAWDITTGSDAVTVAILDTGIDLDHPDLDGTIASYGYDYANGDSDPSDDHGHGTHVGGIVGAITNNSTGVASIGHQTELMAIKVLNSSGSGFHSWIAAGIEDAADHDVEVINMSLGGSSGSSALDDAVEYAYDAGVLIVASSGNTGGSGFQYPAAYPEVMAIGATNSSDNRAGFSTYGTWISMVAPGVSIRSTYCCAGGSYAYLSGTSMAAPHVAGAAALLFAVDGSLSNDEAWETLEDTAVDLGSSGFDAFYGHGRLDAGEAVAEVFGDVTPSPTPSPTPTPVTEVVLPAADSYVAQSAPGTNFGTALRMSVQLSPIDRGYLRFDLDGLEGSVQQATLRLFVLNSTGAPISAHPVPDNGWTETGITFNNAPPFGGAAGSVGSTIPSTWIELDVTSIISMDADNSIALLTSGGTLTVASRELGAFAPELEVTFIPSSPPATGTPLPTATDTPPPTASNTPPPTATNTPLPTASNTPLPTATNTPLPTATSTPPPTATNTPPPTATNTPLPTATNTPPPTATNTPPPTATNTPLPTATNTPPPTATNTPPPTATNTPLPTATNTPPPTATNTPPPTATNTPPPTATNTPLPTATNTPPPTATNTPLPTATNTATPGPSPTPTATQPAVTVQVAVAADAHVDAANPNGNFGLSQLLLLQDPPSREAYLRFDLQGIGTVQEATLRLYSYSSSPQGIEAHPVSDDSWTESGITYSNAPGYGAAIGSSGPFTPGFVEIDVTAAVQGGGDASLAITTVDGLLDLFISRNHPSPSQRPVLEITHQP